MLYGVYKNNVLIPVFLTYILCFCGCQSNTQKESVEALIPQNIVTDLVKSYNDNEKKLIDADLHNIHELCFRDTHVVDNPVYVGTAGGPGACKSTILESYLHDKSNFVYADPDQRSLRYMINTYYQDLSVYVISQHKTYADVLENAYNKWRGASNYIANTILNQAYAGKYNIAHGTTATAKVVEFLYKKLKQNGYKIVLLLCYATDDTRIKSLDHRARVQGFLQNSAEDTINKGKWFPERFPTYFAYADEINLYWTDDFLKGSTCAATYTKNDGLVVHDQKTMDSFIAQYNADSKELNLTSWDEVVPKH